MVDLLPLVFGQERPGWSVHAPEAREITLAVLAVGECRLTDHQHLAGRTMDGGEQFNLALGGEMVDGAHAASAGSGRRSRASTKSRWSSLTAKGTRQIRPGLGQSANGRPRAAHEHPFSPRPTWRRCRRGRTRTVPEAMGDLSKLVDAARFPTRRSGRCFTTRGSDRSMP
jgi:hypothetical protein